jgi:aspartate aminotransferase-like enzyme
MMSKTMPRKKLLMLPGPTNVSERVMGAMSKPMINHRSPDFVSLMESITEKGKYLFQTKENVVTITASGTGGIEAAAFGLIRPGDNVVALTFGEFSQRLVEAVELAGGKVVKVQAELGKVPRLDDVMGAIKNTDRLKAVCSVHNETSTGCAIPYVRELAEAAHEKGAYMVLDGVSSIGGYTMPMDGWGVDMCVTGSQKCIAAPPGLVLVAFNERVADYVKKTPPTVRYFDLAKHLEFLEQGYTPFTPGIPLFYALEEALAVLREETLERRVERHVRCANQLYAAVESMGLSCFADRAVRSNTIITVKCPEGLDDERFREVLSDEHDVAISGGLGPLKGKILRIGSMGNVTSRDIDTTASAMAQTFAEMGQSLDVKRAIV